jgi:hypothetical protein
MYQNNYIFVNKSDTIRESPCIPNAITKKHIRIEMTSIYHLIINIRNTNAGL